MITIIKKEIIELNIENAVDQLEDLKILYKKTGYLINSNDNINISKLDFIYEEINKLDKKINFLNDEVKRKEKIQKLKNSILSKT